MEKITEPNNQYQQPPDEPTMAEETEESRAQQAQKVLDFLVRSNMLDGLSSPEKKLELIKKLSSEEIENFLERINGIIIKMPIHQRSIYEFPGIVMDPETNKPIYVPPKPEVQEKIVRELILPNIDKLPPDEIAEIFASEINVLHMFPNGNGRLARLIYLLLKPDFVVDKSEQCLATISEYLTKREGSLNFDPSVIENELRQTIFDKTSGNDNWSSKTFDVVNLPPTIESIEDYRSDISPQSKLLKRIGYIFSISPFDTLVGLRRYLMSMKKEKAIDFLIQNKEDGTFSIDAKKLVYSIDNETSYGSLVMSLESSKIFRARLIMDMYVRPEYFPSKIPGMSLKKYYQLEVARRAGK